MLLVIKLVWIFELFMLPLQFVPLGCFILLPRLRSFHLVTFFHHFSSALFYWQSVGFHQKCFILKTWWQDGGRKKNKCKRFFGNMLATSFVWACLFASFPFLNMCNFVVLELFCLFCQVEKRKNSVVLVPYQFGTHKTFDT